MIEDVVPQKLSNVYEQTSPAVPISTDVSQWCHVFRLLDVYDASEVGYIQTTISLLGFGIMRLNMILTANRISFQTVGQTQQVKKLAGMFFLNKKKTVVKRRRNILIKYSYNPVSSCIGVIS